MLESIIFAGFGGQGVLLAGKILSVAAMREGKFVSHIPSYGAEMRGGTANCTVVISDDEIASPIVHRPSICIVLNKPSLIKFEPMVQAGGLLIWNSSLIDQEPGREDIRTVAVKANDLAEEAGNVRSANMVALGLLAALRSQLSSMKSLEAALDETISSRHKDLNAINIAAMRKGFEVA